MAENQVTADSGARTETVTGQAGEELLDSYEIERKPVAARNIEWAMLTSFNLLATQGGWGVIPDAPPEHNVMSFQAMFAPTPDGATRLVRLGEFLRTQRLEYQAHDIEIGYDYATSPIVTADGSDAPPHDPFGTEHVQTARPGHRVPHAWFGRGGERFGTHSLLRPGVFLLLLVPTARNGAQPRSRTRGAPASRSTSSRLVLTPTSRRTRRGWRCAATTMPERC
jgi:hypothetical protein